MAFGALIKKVLIINHPISFVTKRNRVKPERKVFYPLQFAPANAVPLSKGTKTLHRKIGDFDSRPPSFRPTAVFNQHFLPDRLFNFKTWQNMAFGALIKSLPC
jgi:hypothetical protein